LWAVTIHSSDPFATPEGERSPSRRLRGRLPAPVTLWTAYDQDHRPAGLTVSSTVVVDGDPARVLGVLDEESALWDALRQTNRFALEPLHGDDRQLADKFAGLLPAPGGVFAAYHWRDTDFGPVLRNQNTWAGCRVETARAIGWGLLVEATIDHIDIGPDDDEPLIHYRGRYVTLPPQQT
jgi:3-hydroxy-9,10-secoandrosta-1,3,5(10)-triene-9,17-dione monooxygenase reductase component